MPMMLRLKLCHCQVMNQIKKTNTNRVTAFGVKGAGYKGAMGVKVDFPLRVKDDSPFGVRVTALGV